MTSGDLFALRNGLLLFYCETKICRYGIFKSRSRCFIIYSDISDITIYRDVSKVDQGYTCNCIFQYMWDNDSMYVYMHAVLAHFKDISYLNAKQPVF